MAVMFSSERTVIPVPGDAGNAWLHELTLSAALLRSHQTSPPRVQQDLCEVAERTDGV
jgi:hypothetical protein